MPQRLICLVPARNAARDLPDFLDSVRHFSDAVIALDDGSTDDTRAILEADPLVVRVLTNPVRPDYQGWDDAGNRNRLLEAAGEFDPDWIISLDADERIDPTDALALREFIETDALPGCAYGFRAVPMRGDESHYIPRYQWVFRLFSYQPGLRFPSIRLHFIPIPTAIPRARWLRTTIRIQHLGAMTDERRLSRFAKYLEADPERTYQSDYTHLLRSPAESDLRQWTPRPSGLPVLLGALPSDQLSDGASFELPDETDGFTTDAEHDVSLDESAVDYALSVIVISRNDEATIERTMASIVSQDCPEPFEVILVTSGTDRTADIVRERFPTVTVVALDRPALPGEARNAGLYRARGTFVSFPGSHIELPAGSLKARLQAHRRGYAMVTGVAVNGTDTPAGWASYFLDHHEGLPGHRPARIQGPPAHCSYARIALHEVGGFPEGVRTAEDTEVNRALVRRGYVAFREPAIEFVHRSPCRTPWRLVRHHFARGRGAGRLLVKEYRDRGRLLRRPDVIQQRLIRHIPDRLDRIAQNVSRADPSLRGAYTAVRPLMALGAVASWSGMWWEIVRPAPAKLAVLFREPVVTVVLGSFDAASRNAWLIRLDRIARRAQVITLPSLAELLVENAATSDSEDRIALRPREVASGDVRHAVERRTGLKVTTVIAGPDSRMQRIVHRLQNPPSRSGYEQKATSLWGSLTTLGTMVKAMQGRAVRSDQSRLSRLILAVDLARVQDAMVTNPAPVIKGLRGATAGRLRRRIAKVRNGTTQREEFWA